MPTYKVGRKAATKELEIIDNADAFTASFVTIGSFVHDHVTNDVLGAPLDDNHVFFHHVRDLLYAAGDLNPAAYKLIKRGVTGISSLPATATKAVAETQQITNTISPANAFNKAVHYKTSDPAKATVDASGLVTAVASGTATITVTTDDGGFQDTLVLTIS